MDELDKKDAFAQVMMKSKLEMPFSDFEDVVMQRIQEESAKKSEILKEIKLSRFFFVIGSIVGFVISILLSGLKEPFFGVDQHIIALLFQIGFATFFFTQVESFLKIKKQ